MPSGAAVTGAAEKALLQSDSFEDRKERFMRRVVMMEAQARSQLRLIGPQCITEDAFAVRKCDKCNPPPEMFKCPVCDWECDQRWRLKLHFDTNPKWCRDRGAKKARAFSRKV